MKKYKLYGYQQEMLGKIIETLTSVTQVTFYDQNGKKAKVGRSVMVKKASTERKRMTSQELKAFKKNVKPFLQEDTMRMGLKSGNEIVLRPIYPYISPFRGDHAIFRLNNHNYLYGVLDRLGYIVVSPEYQSLDFLNAHTLVGRKPHSDSESINL